MSTENKRNPVLDFWQQASQKMASDYERIRDIHQGDGGTAGSQGESNWQALLRDWIPPYYRIKKHGRIQYGRRLSDQVDLVILDPAYPEALANEQVYLAEGVVAAFECKNTLTAKYIRAAMATASELTNSHSKCGHGTPFKELHRPYFYGLLAQSHSWKADGSSPQKNVALKLQEGLVGLGSPQQMLDVVCVADLATWGSIRWWSLPRRAASTSNAIEDGIVEGGYTCIPHQTSPNRGGAIGAMLWWLLSWLSHRDDAVQRLLGAYQYGGVGGDNSGFKRQWQMTKVLSPELTAWLSEGSGRGVTPENWHRGPGRP